MALVEVAVVAVVVAVVVVTGAVVEDTEPLDALVVSLTVFIEYVCVVSSVSVVLLTQY